MTNAAVSTGQNIAFWTLFVVIVVTALATVLQRNIVHCAVSLMLCFLGIAGLYIVLHAEFLAGVQVLIYVGAITVLMIFAIMLTQQVTGRGVRQTNRQSAAGIVMALMTLGMLGGLLQQVHFAPVLATTPPANTTATIGTLFVTEYVWPFELASVVLLVALVGAIFIARDKPAAQRQDTTSPGTTS